MQEYVLYWVGLARFDTGWLRCGRPRRRRSLLFFVLNWSGRPLLRGMQDGFCDFHRDRGGCHSLLYHDLLLRLVEVAHSSPLELWTLWLVTLFSTCKPPRIQVGHIGLTLTELLDVGWNLDGDGDVSVRGAYRASSDSSREKRIAYTNLFDRT